MHAPDAREHAHTDTHMDGKLNVSENWKIPKRSERMNNTMCTVHCTRIDFRKIKKKTFSNEKPEKKLMKRHSNRERKRSVCRSIFCVNGIYIFYFIFRRYIV